MTEILLDDRPFATGEGVEPATVSQLLDRAKAGLVGTGRLLVSLRCDGETLSETRLESILEEPASRFGRLELYSDRPKTLVLEALTATRRSFGESFANLRETSDALATGDGPAAMSSLAVCVDAWNKAQEAIIKGGGLLGVDFESLQLDGRPVAEWLTELLERLRDLKDAVANRDHVLLADILRYEFDDVLQRWERMLDGFIEHVEALPDDAGCTPGA